LTLLVGRQEGHLACKKYGGWWRWALLSPDGVVPSWLVGMSASVNRPLHNKVQKFSSGTGSNEPSAPETGVLDVVVRTQWAPKLATSVQIRTIMARKHSGRRRATAAQGGGISVCTSAVVFVD